jgi:selenocysteine lyase/cysteine desulfurase
VAPTPSAEEFRRHFPALTDPDRGTVHLASCSHGPLSDALATALGEYQYTLREYGAPWERWMAEVDRARALFAELIHADYDEIAVLPSASNAAYQVASTQDYRARPGLVTADAEFGSIAQVWLAQQPRGAEVRHVANADGPIEPAAYRSLIDEHTALVSVPLVAYRTGARLPVAEILACARTAGARTVIDAYQGAGVEPVDVRELDCDYLISGTLKYLLGLPGMAFLYARAGLTDPVAPAQTGWFGRVEPFALDTRTLDHPGHARRFESGTPSVPAAYGAVAGMSLIAELDPKRVGAHIADLSAQLDQVLREQGETLASPRDPQWRGPVVAIVDTDPYALCAELARERIVASPRADFVRLSLHYFNSSADIDRVAAAIARYRRGGGR